jgi:replicative DNA helicase
VDAPVTDVAELAIAGSISSEQAVIAAVLLDARVLRFAVDGCSGSDFGDPRLGRIFEGLVEMFAAREPIDVITVGEKLAGWELRGLTAMDLHRWTADVPSAAHVGSYAAAVRDASIRRTVEAAGVRLQSAAKASDDMPAALSRAMDELTRVRDSTSRVEVAARPLGSVLAMHEDDHFDWVIEGLLERGDRLMLTGSEGGGKTTLLRQMAIAAAAGVHPFSFFPMRPARVLYVDVENSEKQWSREARPIVARAAIRGSLNPEEVLRLACIKRIDVTRDGDLGLLHKLVDEHTPDVLFIGPLYRLIPRAINSDDDAAPLLAALDTLRDRGLAMVIEAHAGHSLGSGGERDMRPRGSSALLGWPEFGLGLRPDKGAKSSNEFQLVRWRGHRDASRKWPSRIARGISDWPWTPTTALV